MGGSVVVAPSWREASEATNAVIIVSGLGYGFVGMGSGLLVCHWFWPADILRGLKVLWGR